MNALLPITSEHQANLLGIARQSIEHGLRQNQPLPIAAKDYPIEWQTPRAVFVTLTLNEELRGCIGTLESGQPLVVNVAKYAYSAAFRDPRFPPLTADELPLLHIAISILSDLEPMSFESETDLLAQIRAGIDGLLLEEGSCRGTLLPSVWKSIPETRDFLRQLKRKAGLRPDHWSDKVRLFRYTTVCIP